MLTGFYCKWNPIFSHFHTSAITPYITQIKLYSPGDNLFYGYCNKAQVYCVWNPKRTELLEYIDEATFQEKQLHVDTITAAGLDDMELKHSSTIESEKADIGCKDLLSYTRAYFFFFPPQYFSQFKF